MHGPAQRSDWLDPLMRSVALGESVALEGPTGAGKRAVAHLAGAMGGGTVAVLEPGDGPAPSQGPTTWLVLDVETFPRAALRGVAAHVAAVPGSSVVATTTRSLDLAVREGAVPSSFRALFARAAFHVPPIEERLEDLPAIVALAARRQGIDPARLSPAFLERLALAGWPDGLARLDELLSSCAFGNGPLDVGSSSFALSRRPRRKLVPLTALDADLARSRVVAALERAHGSIILAARALGVSRQRLYREGQQLGLRVRASSGPAPSLSSNCE